MKITRMTNTDEGFYALLGPFLANRQVVKQVGDTIWDDQGKTWYIAQERGEVVGFVAVLEQGRTTRMESLYLTDDDRADVATTLTKRAVADFGHDRDLTVTVITPHAPHYQQAGFTTISQVGKRFTKLARPADVRDKADRSHQ